MFTLCNPDGTKIYTLWNNKKLVHLTNQDLNTIIDVGVYYMENVDSCTNKPNVNNCYNNVLEVIAFGAGRIYQRFYSANLQKIFIRGAYYSSSSYVFTSWVAIN